MTRLSRQHAAAPWAALLAAAWLDLAGCAKNDASTVLAPTGIRPAPATPTGSLVGEITFDTLSYPGLGAPPYPPTRIELQTGGVTIAVESLATSGRRFEFDRLPRGIYQALATSHAFVAGKSPFDTVVDSPRASGVIELLAASGSLENTVFVIGTMPGMSDAELQTFSTLMDQNVLGVWTYPNGFATPDTIPAGTFRLKLVTDASSTLGNLIGYGGDSTQVLTAPFQNVPVRASSGPASDLEVRFPATAVYAFTFDERRLTLSVQPAPAPLATPRRVRAHPRARSLR